MPLFALDPASADFYTAWGFWVGVVGTVVGVVGFGVTIWQLVITRRAVEAAKLAAEETLAENKEAFERFVAGYAGRLLSELTAAVVRKDFRLAEVRANDLADLLASLPASGPTDAADARAVRGLREFALLFAEKAARPSTPGLGRDDLRERWNPLLLQLHDRLGRLRHPFRGPADDPHGPDPAAAPVPGPGPRAVGEDPGRAGDVGPDAGPGRGP